MFVTQASGSPTLTGSQIEMFEFESLPLQQCVAQCVLVDAAHGRVRLRLAKAADRQTQVRVKERESERE